MNKLIRRFITAAVLLLPAFVFAAGVQTQEQALTLGYSVYGQGAEKVIVLHDWMGDASNYEPVIPYLDPNTFTWMFADVRGYGRSRNLKGAYTVEEVAADVFRLADALGWKRFHVVGHPCHWRAAGSARVSGSTLPKYPGQMVPERRVSIHHRCGPLPHARDTGLSGDVNRKVSTQTPVILVSPNMGASALAPYRYITEVVTHSRPS